MFHTIAKGAETSQTVLRFRSIESLRAWMAWWVVLGHALVLGGFSTQVDNKALELLMRFLLSGTTAVNVFIVVSGFVICHLITSRPEPYKFYIARRFLRIFPIFVVCVLLAIVLRDLYQQVYLQDWVTGQSWRRDRIAAEDSYFWLHIGLHLSMLHGMLPDSFLPFSSSAFLAPAWSLSLEWQFYLTAPLLLIWLTGRPWVMVLTGLAMLGGVLLVSSGLLGHWRYPSFLPGSFQYFLMGIACRLLLETQTAVRRWLLIGLILLSAILADWKVLVIWGAFYAIVLMESGRLPQARGLLARIIRLIALNPVLFHVGTWSFSTYLVHIPVFVFLVGGAQLLTGAEISQSQTWPLIVLGMILTLPLSWLLYITIERPFIRLGRKLKQTD